MKILLASGNSIYDSNYSDTRREQTGFAIMIRALADMLPMEGDVVDVITQSNFTSGHKIGGSNLLPKTWLKLFLHTKPFYLRKAFKFCKYDNQPLKNKLRTILYFMTGSYTEHLIKKNKYDVVHINGIGLSSITYMYACIRTNTPFVLTLHGLISFSDGIKAGKFSKKLERQFFIQNKDNPKALSTVISTGIKKRLCSVVGKDMDTINVVCNPIIEFVGKGRSAYRKEDGEKVVVTVGNISDNKNQRLVVDAFAQMCKEHPGKYKLFVIGGHEEQLKKYACESGFDNVVFTGTLERGDVYSYYSIADLCVMASYEEGFGLSLVEGYSFGVPSVMPSAIDAFYDLCRTECCVAAGDYGVGTFADVMYTALTKSWDHQAIKEFSEMFSEGNCAKSYLKVLRLAGNLKSAPFDMQSLDRLVSESAK